MRRAEDGEPLLLIGVAMGRVMTIRKDTATHEAKDAARAGRSLNDACPYPFLSEAGRYSGACMTRHAPSLRSKGGRREKADKAQAPAAGEPAGAGRAAGNKADG